MIKLNQVRKSFGERNVLDGISFEIKKGEIVFLLGRSGTGKSVSLKLMVGLLAATSGEILIDGTNVTRFNEEEFQPIRKKCGMVFQHPALFDSISVFENVAYGLRKSKKFSEDEIKQKVKRCLDLVHVQDVNARFPQEISYGTQKRVSLARTVAVEPQILLFDEPTTGLDPISTNAINQLIRDLSRELHTTSVVVSHDMRCAIEIADRIIILDGGKIIDEGTPQQIMNSSLKLVQEFMAEAKNA